MNLLVLTGAFVAPQPTGLTRFLKQQGQVGTASGSSSTVAMTALNHALLYLYFRVGGACGARDVEGIF